MVPSDQLPKNYDFAEVEERWRRTWRDEDNYFDKNSKKPQFVIDTPPPYPTGNFHIGNALNWCYIDFFARYKRMKGFNVMFPQGWDCHGLPTEVKVEEINKITKNDVSREEFRRMCRDLTIKNIEAMRITLRKMAFSTDWSNEYITMMPAYYSKTQLSFLRMLESGYIYQSEHPVNYCTRCETAIAFAEVAYEDRETTLNFFDFDGVEIATTRPELLAACVAVAVHPGDDRYHKLRGKSMKVPLFGHDVPVVQDEAVDPAFGSGAVMICTFGDKQDVHWWKQHNLALRKAIDRQGKMTDIAGRYKGLNTSDCRKAILADMQAQKILKRQEKLAQRVGTCWRCKTPIEILSERQWFVKIKPDEIQKVEAAHGTKPKETIVGYDALAIYVHTSNPADTISLDQLAEIYGWDGAITRWSQLDGEQPAGARDRIVRVSRQSGCGTHAPHRSVVCPECLQQVEQAISLYQGNFLEGLTLRDEQEFEDWLTLEREKLRLKALEALQELADSIKEQGIIQPLIVRAVNGKLELIAGERRWRASKKLGLATVPVIEREASDRDVLEMALIEVSPQLTPRCPM